MITSQKKDELLKAISYVQSKKTLNSKKLTMKDLMLFDTKNYEEKSKNRNNNIKSFRQQEEYGPKKHIKPWRTSTKSQQQIVPKGHKKGFRGNSVASTNTFKNKMRQTLQK